MFESLHAMSESIRILVLLLSAVVYALAFPPHDWRPLVLVGLGGFFWSLQGCTTGQACLYGLLWGLVTFAFGLSWLWNLFSGFAVLLWLILALFPAAFAMLCASAQMRGLGGWSLAAFFALTWCAMEFIRCELMPLRFPWMSVGLALEPWPLVSWIGVYGLGLVIALIVAGMQQVGWNVMWLLPVLGVAWVFEMRLIKAPEISVALVQAESAPLNRYLALSEKTAETAKLIVWPEYAVPKDVRASGDLAAIQAFAAKRTAILVFGTQTGLGGAKWQNTALTIDGSRVLGEHGKHHTVHLFNDGETGPTMKAIDTPLGRMGTPVCFDCDFQDVVRRMTLDGAAFFAVPSMDASHWGEKQHIQHAQFFRLRAAENRRAFIVAASSGVSQIITPNGVQSQNLPTMVEGVMDGVVTPQKDITFFTRFGWLTPWLALSAVTLWFAWLLWMPHGPIVTPSLK